MEKTLEFLRKRVGLVLGCLLFCAGTLFANNLVLGVEFVGSNVYQREALAALEERGIKLFSPYKTGAEDLVCAKLLALDGVEFCSVKKTGGYVRVEMRLSAEEKRTPQNGDMRSAYEGELLSLTVLRGTPLKKSGDSVKRGEPLVGGWFTPEGGEQVRVQPIARASIACTYEGLVEAEDAQSAFAAAYLTLGLSDLETITQNSVTKTNGGYLVKICYTATQQINF